MLLEAVIAVAIIALVAIGVLAAVALQVRTADKAALLLHARALAEDRMTMLRTLDHGALLHLPDSLATGVFPPPFDAFSWEATVSPIRDEHDLFAARVTVFVADEAFVLETLLHQPQVLSRSNFRFGDRAVVAIASRLRALHAGVHGGVLA